MEDNPAMDMIVANHVKLSDYLCLRRVRVLVRDTALEMACKKAYDDLIAIGFDDSFLRKLEFEGIRFGQLDLN